MIASLAAGASARSADTRLILAGYAVPREAVATVLGAERAAFARAFGRLGDPDEAAAAHRAAGLADVAAVLEAARAA